MNYGTNYDWKGIWKGKTAKSKVWTFSDTAKQTVQENNEKIA